MNTAPGVSLQSVETVIYPDKAFNKPARIAVVVQFEIPWV